jgi:hypothetical protein
VGRVLVKAHHLDRYLVTMKAIPFVLTQQSDTLFKSTLKQFTYT